MSSQNRSIPFAVDTRTHVSDVLTVTLSIDRLVDGFVMNLYPAYPVTGLTRIVATLADGTQTPPIAIQSESIQEWPANAAILLIYYGDYWHIVSSSEATQHGIHQQTDRYSCDDLYQVTFPDDIIRGIPVEIKYDLLPFFQWQGAEPSTTFGGVKYINSFSFTADTAFVFTDELANRQPHIYGRFNSLTNTVYDDFAYVQIADSTETVFTEGPFRTTTSGGLDIIAFGLRLPEYGLNTTEDTQATSLFNDAGFTVNPPTVELVNQMMYIDEGNRLIVVFNDDPELYPQTCEEATQYMRDVKEGAGTEIYYRRSNPSDTPLTDVGTWGPSRPTAIPGGSNYWGYGYTLNDTFRIRAPYVVLLTYLVGSEYLIANAAHTAQLAYGVTSSGPDSTDSQKMMLFKSAESGEAVVSYNDFYYNYDSSIPSSPPFLHVPELHSTTLRSQVINSGTGVFGNHSAEPGLSCLASGALIANNFLRYNGVIPARCLKYDTYITVGEGSGVDIDTSKLVLGEYNSGIAYTLCAGDWIVDAIGNVAQIMISGALATYRGNLSLEGRTQRGANLDTSKSGILLMSGYLSDDYPILDIRLWDPATSDWVSDGIGASISYGLLFRDHESGVTYTRVDNLLDVQSIFVGPAVEAGDRMYIAGSMSNGLFVPEEVVGIDDLPEEADGRLYWEYGYYRSDEYDDRVDLYNGKIWTSKNTLFG